MNDIYTITSDDFPFLLKQINDPPKRLYIKGTLPKEDAKILCIVGARKHSSYGEEVCKKLISGLKGYNICIVSGLALGIDSIAHKSAIQEGLQTIAFPGSGLDEKVLYPNKHKRFAEEIIDSGGALISEFELEQNAQVWTFPQRNRLMAGISHATLVIEARLKSGTLITSKHAVDYNRDVGAVPGQIFSQLSEGPNMLIDLGAKMIRNSDDILEMLGLKRKEETKSIQPNLFMNLSENEKKIVEFLEIEPHTTEQIILKSRLSAKEINEGLSALEIQGLITENSGKFNLI